MKNYFSFNLTGRELLPIWILFLVCFMAPYLTLVISMKYVQPGSSLLYLFFPIVLLLAIIAFVITFYLARLVIGKVAFKGQHIVFHGKFSEFIKVLGCSLV
jgi:bacteriorhodopsin